MLLRAVHPAADSTERQQRQPTGTDFLDDIQPRIQRHPRDLLARQRGASSSDVRRTTATGCEFDPQSGISDSWYCAVLNAARSLYAFCPVAFCRRRRLSFAILITQYGCTFVVSATKYSYCFSRSSIVSK